MMDKLALEMEAFEEILERFEEDITQAKACNDYSQMVRSMPNNSDLAISISSCPATFTGENAVLKVGTEHTDITDAYG